MPEEFTLTSLEQEEAMQQQQMAQQEQPVQ
jgi:hypothetical protein